MKEIFGEFLGTLLLLLLGNGVVAGVVLPKTKSHNSGWIVITMGWGIAVAIAAFVSGNLVPAVYPRSVCRCYGRTVPRLPTVQTSLFG